MEQFEAYSYRVGEVNGDIWRRDSVTSLPVDRGWAQSASVFSLGRRIEAQLNPRMWSALANCAGAAW